MRYLRVSLFSTRRNKKKRGDLIISRSKHKHTHTRQIPRQGAPHGTSSERTRRARALPPWPAVAVGEEGGASLRHGPPRPTTARLATRRLAASPPPRRARPVQARLRLVSGPAGRGVGAWKGARRARRRPARPSPPRALAMADAG